MKKYLLAAILFLGTSALAQQIHYTVLTWNPVVPSGQTGTTAAQILTGYNIYRSNTSGSYTTPLATVPFGTNTYTDTPLVAGSTHYYVATTVCSNCTVHESGYSNEAKAVTPLDNPPPPPAPVITGSVN